MAKILLIEDVDDNATLVRKVLTSRGYQFLWAKTAEAGLQSALEQIPDLILLDLGLPDMDGQTLASILRAEPGLEKIPLVAMTAWPEDTALQMVAAYRLDAYISKPFNLHMFLKKIADLLAEPR